jgi:hypothetical protein
MKELIAQNNYLLFYIKIIGYLFFSLAMLNLLFSLKRSDIRGFKGWNFFKISLSLFIIWGVINLLKIFLNIEEKIFILDYLIALLALFLLFWGLFKIYEEKKKEFI